MKNEDKTDEDSEDEEEVEAKYQNLMKKIFDDYIDVSTRYGYRLNQRRILEFLYAKSKIVVSKKKGNIGVEARKLLHDDLMVALDAVEVPDSRRTRRRCGSRTTTSTRHSSRARDESRKGPPIRLEMHYEIFETKQK
jgi:hypothetical protein